jgi:hypothetical protein
MTAQEQVTARRKEYMDADRETQPTAHADYYEWLSDFIGLTDNLIPFTAAQVDASTDEHLNDLPLRQWDAMDGFVRQAVRRVPGGLSWALSDTVCCLKAMAKRRQRRLGVRSRFAEDYGMPREAVDQLVGFAVRAGDANEHCVNGDPHPSYPNATDKNFNSQRWGAIVNDLTKQIADLVRPYGFTGIEYTGLGPTLKRGDRFIEVPY